MKGDCRKSEVISLDADSTGLRPERFQKNRGAFKGAAAADGRLGDLVQHHGGMIWCAASGEAVQRAQAVAADIYGRAEFGSLQPLMATIMGIVGTPEPVEVEALPTAD